MKTRSLINMLGGGLLLLALTTATTPSAQAQGAVVKRDLQEWLNAQGTAYPPHPLAPETPMIWSWMNYPDLNNDGVLDGVWYDLWYDYAGVLGRPSSYGGVLGPKSITGTVTERPIGNGMAEVTVRAKVASALIWVTAHSCCAWEPFLRDLPTVFGHREAEIIADPSLPAARANVDFTVTFLNEVGAAMPDLNTSWELGRFNGFHVQLSAEGPLTEAFGELEGISIPEGTPGKLRWGKPGLQTPANPKAWNGAASGFPNDQFHLFPIGNK